jgi:hypothetical protein
MFKRRTLFIVGAGASQEVGFPLGTELAKSIGNRLVRNIDRDGGLRRTTFNDPSFYEQIRDRHPSEFADYVSAGQQISAGIRLANSIDDFLNIHSDNTRIKIVGKAAIVRTILEAERNSSIYVDQSIIDNKLDWARVEDTWFVKLIRILGPDVTVANVDSLFDKVSFIIFNYDRCLEHVLIHALPSLYSISPEAASKIVDKIAIVHPYGTVGEIKSIKFGGDLENGESYFDLAARIKTYTEQIEEGHIVEAIHEMVGRAESIVFLGLAYAEQNMALLRPPKRMDRKPIFGTAYGLSESDRRVVEASILSMMKPPPPLIDPPSLVNLANMKCAQLFNDYARSLNAAG